MFGVPPRFFIVQPSSRKTRLKLYLGWLTGTWLIYTVTFSYCDYECRYGEAACLVDRWSIKRFEDWIRISQYS